jgi:hypothetical protein
MKKFVYGFAFGFSFFVADKLLEYATTSVADKPYAWLMYLALPLLIGIHYITEEVK